MDRITEAPEENLGAENFFKFSEISNKGPTSSIFKVGGGSQVVATPKNKMLLS